jgi:hypothetical protein
MHDSCGHLVDQRLLPSVFGRQRTERSSFEFVKFECEALFSGGQAETDATKGVFFVGFGGFSASAALGGVARRL